LVELAWQIMRENLNGRRNQYFKNRDDETGS